MTFANEGQKAAVGYMVGLAQGDTTKYNVARKDTVISCRELKVSITLKQNVEEHPRRA